MTTGRTDSGMAVAQPDESNAGEPQAASIEELFHALESPLLGYARQLTGDPALAEDVVQEAFMKLHAQWQTVRQPKSWLYRTVHNVALNHLRRSHKIVPLSQGPDSADPAAAEGTDPGPAPDEAMIQWEGIGLVRLSLQRLDERSRELVRLKFQESLSYQQMSERTGLTVGHVGYLLHHALKAIAADLANTGIVP